MRAPLETSNKTYAKLSALLDEDESGPAAEVLTDCWAAGLITTDELAWQLLRRIEEDVNAGVVPWNVADFSELHNYVDANMYSVHVHGCDMSDEGTALANAVQTRVSELLCGSTAPGYWERRDDFPRDERKAAYDDYASDLSIYLLRMGRQ